MTKLKLFIFICFCALSTITQAQYTLTIDDVRFSNGQITDYTNATEKSIIIPDNFDGVAVETIGNNAFKNNALTHVIIPNSVRSIGNNAFQDNQLISVIIGNSVKSIGSWAFQNNQLTEVSIPNSVESIGQLAFQRNKLTHVSISNSVKSIERYVFSRNKLTEVIIPDSVNSIGEYAFSDNQLTNVIIPNSVKSIGNWVFHDNLLTQVNIPNSVKIIGDATFHTNKLTEVIIPNSVKSIGGYAFYQNTGLTSFNLPTHYQGYSYSWSKSKKSGDEITDFTLDYVLYEGTKGSAVDFTITYTLDGGTNAANNPAKYTVKTETITLADASKTGRTFKGWYSEAAFTNQVTEIATGSIGDISLYAKYSDEYTLQLSDVDFSDGEIIDYTNATEKNIIIPDNFNDVAVTFIGENAFQNNQLTQVSIGNSVNSIGKNAFNGNTDTGLTSFNLPTDYQGYSYSWSNGKKSGDEITDFTLRYVLDENSKGDAVDFTISYTLNGGTNSNTNPANYIIETETIILADASKPGRTFKGWYSEATFTNQVTEIAAGSTGDISLYAKYSHEYTLQLSDVTFSNGEITDYTNPTEKNIIIPDNFNGVAVTSIGEDTFYNNKLTNVSIPNSVNSIGKNAFYENQLTEVSIGNSVNSIGESAFAGNQLTEVSIGNSVNSIGESAFAGNQLTEVSIGNSVTSVGKDAFKDNKLTNVSIPNPVNSIGEGAFASNKLTEVSIGNSVNSIGKNAFYENQLTEVSIGNSVNSIGESAFAGNQLTEVSIGNSVNSIGEGAFANNHLTQISIPNSVNSIGESAFYNNKLTHVIIPNSVTSIGGYAFSFNTGLTSFNLPTHHQGYSYSWSNSKKSGDEITDFALSYELDEDSKGNAVDFTITYTLDGGTNAANNPADYTVETATITLADASKTWRTFKGWYSEATFTNQVTEIATGSTGDISLYAKYSDEYTLQLSDVDFSDGEIIDYTNATEKNIIIPDNFDGVAVTSIGEGAFQNNQLTQVSIPNSVNSIGKNAFSDNTGLTSFNLPADYQGSSYSWSNGKKSGDEITDFALSYELDEGSKGDAVDFTISYTLDGGTNDANNPADYTVETATITLADASKDGYTFEGWYSDAAFTADNEVTEIATGSTGPKEFFAKFSDAITYNITYTLDGGTNDANNPADYTVESATITLAEASKDGYTFGGWYSDAAFTADNEVTEIATGSTGPKEFFAKFSEFYIITYNLDGGTNGGNPISYTVETATITLAEASKDHYTFEGWYSDAAFTNQVTEIATGSTGAKEFFAKFSDAITYDITYTLDGGTNDANNPADYTVETATITLAEASKDGYTFEGWYSDAAFTADNEVTEIATGSTGPKEFFAKFSDAITYDIAYTLDGGTNDANNPADYTVESATITLEDASKDGYTFEGWYSDAAFTADNEVTEIATGSTGDVILYAKFDAITYDITYTLDGGTNDANNPADYTVETATITLENASKDHYTFEGWYSDAAFTNQVTEIATGSTGHKEFFAKFSDAITYNISYTLDGGTNDANNPADYTVETATITLGNASKDGYTFEGWYSDAAFTNQVTEIATGSTGSKEFFAKFSDAITYDISYTLDGGTNDANNPANYTIETATITLADATKDGYTFEGWYSDAVFTADNEVTEIATGSTEPKEFFAKFSDAITYDITYTLDGGTNAANNPADYTVETATITLADASKDGYTFEGWYSDAAFTADNEVTEIATGSTGDVVLFAKYSEIALGIYTTNIKVFNFYPNPSIDFIQTELEVSSLTIRSISGSKVKQFEGGSFFDISNLKSGVYILLAIDKNGDTYKSKLLKE